LAVYCKKNPPSFDKPTPFDIKTFIIKTIYEERFEGKPGEDQIAHLKKFEKRCEMIKLNNVICEVIKIKMFPYSLGEKSNWFLDFPLGTSHPWINLKSAFMEIFGLRSVMSYNKEVLFLFKQQSDEWLVHTWERFRGIAYGQEHGLRDWMIIRAFYLGLSTKSKSYVDLKSGKTILEHTTTEAQNLLDGILLERKIYDELNATNIPSEPFDDRYEIYETIEEVKNVL
jgi:hypothetical protein